MRLLSFALGAILVAAAAVVGLAFVGEAKSSCADGAVAVSPAAEASFNQKWSTFESAAKRGEAASVTFNESELTSRGARYLADSNAPIKNLQVHLCAGQGKGQATAQVEVLGNQRPVVVTGHLQDDASGARVVVDSVQVGTVPEQIGALLANSVVDAANIRASIHVGDMTSTTSEVTLKSKR